MLTYNEIMPTQMLIVNRDRMIKRIWGFLACFAWCLCAHAQVGVTGTLPVLVVTTNEGAEITSTETYVAGSYYLDPMGHEEVAQLGSAEAPLPLQIRGRGNFTWTNYEKKPYRLKLDKKANLMGRGKSKHYCLLPHCDDYYGFLRNTVGFELSRRMGLAWTPGQVPVELVLNDDYKGIYFLTEQIKVDPNRVNIEEQDDGETDPELITGGWLLEIDNYLEEGQIEVHDEDGKLRLLVTPHSPEDLSPEQRTYIETLLSDVEKSLDEIPENPATAIAWEDYIDMDTLACFYIVNELLDNIEAFHGSCWMHKQRGEDTKLLFGPVWDFGNTFNRSKEEPDFIYNLPEPRAYASHWIDRISQSPRFQACVKSHYADFRATGGTDLDAFINNFYNEIHEAVARDAERWPELGTVNLQSRQDAFKEMLAAKIDFLDDKWLNSNGVQEIARDGDGSFRIVDMAGRVVAQGNVFNVSSLERGRLYILEQNGTSTVFLVP